MEITKEDWKEIDKIGIDKTLLEKNKCGLSFKTVGGQMCCSSSQKFKLMELNTKIQSRK